MPLGPRAVCLLPHLSGQLCVDPLKSAPHRSAPQEACYETSEDDANRFGALICDFDPDVKNWASCMFKVRCYKTVAPMPRRVWSRGLSAGWMGERERGK